MLLSFEKEFEKIKLEYLSGKYKNEIEKSIKILSSRSNVIFGAGIVSYCIFESLINNQINVECFCDNYKSGYEENTLLPIISIDTLCKNYFNCNVIICTTNPNVEKEIYEQLILNKFPSSQIFSFSLAYRLLKNMSIFKANLTLSEFEENHLDGYEYAYNFFEDENSKKIIIEKIKNYVFNDMYSSYNSIENLYFPSEIKLSDNEVFIDAGLYDGDTTIKFIDKVNGNYKKIVGFDIDPQNIKLAEDNLKFYNNINIYDKGLWYKDDTKFAEIGKKSGSYVNENSLNEITLTTLDNIFINELLEDYPTYMKFDIEGSEQEALLGAENIISLKKPKLAISVYHKPEDVYVIPKMLYKLNSKYRFCLKHYTPYFWETVCYAY